MPTVNRVVNVAAGLQNDNLISGSTYEQPDRNYWGRLLITADAAGASRVTVLVGDKIQLEESPVSRGNRVPIEPDDVILRKFPCPAGKRIIVKARNPSGGAVDFFCQLVLTPA